MQVLKLARNILGSLDALTDKQIIEIDAGRLGLTAFKNSLRVEVTPGLTQDTWHDARLRSYWEDLYGPGYFVELYGTGEENVYDMACPDVETGECVLDEKLKDSEWVAEYATAARYAMISRVRESAQTVIDHFNSLDLVD